MYAYHRVRKSGYVYELRSCKDKLYHLFVVYALVKVAILLR